MAQFGRLGGPGTQAPPERDIPLDLPAPAWLGSEPETPAPARTLSADVVVLGAGHAGLACARRAAERGLSVIVCEAQTEAQYAPFGFDIGHLNSAWQASHGIPHFDPTEFISGYQLQCAGRAQPDLIRDFARRSGEAFDWFIAPLSEEERGQIVPLCWPMAPDYETRVGPFLSYPGSAELPGPLMRTAMRAGIERARQNGAQVLFGTKAIRLLHGGGRVTGAVCQDENGGILHLNAARGVVLAAGDCAGDPEMLRGVCTEASDINADRVIRGPGRDGSGIRMGLWAGGRLEAGPRGAMGGTHALPLGPGGTIATLWLNRDGRRYCNEAFGSPATAGAQGARQPGGMLYAVWDGNWERAFYHQMAAHFNLKYWGDGMRSDLTAIMTGAREAGPAGFTSGRTTIYCAETPELLADYLGLTGSAKENFAASIARFNHWCDIGVDEDYARDPSTLHALDTPPYYAFGTPKMTGMIMVSLAGLEVNGEQNCLGRDFEPIGGLYATGNCSGGRFPLQYTSPMNGISIGMALTLGYCLGDRI